MPQRTVFAKLLTRTQGHCASQRSLRHALSRSIIEHCKATPYTPSDMIRSFRHKGLKALHQRGDAAGVRADHVARLCRLLAALEVAKVPDDMLRPGNRLHPLRGPLAGFWSVNVSGNWRLVFRFVGVDVHQVDYLDYH